MDELETIDPFEKMLKEERAAQEALSSRYKALQSSLERRINLPFDPTLMRVATALLSPTKSGSTGESIAMASEAVLDQSEKESLRQREVLKMQAELEERMLEMKRQGLGLQALQRVRPGQKPTDPTKPVAPAGIPSGAIGIQIAPPNPSYMPDEEYAVMLYSSGKKPGEIAEAIEKRRRDNLEFRESGVLDKSTNMLYLTPKGGKVEGFPVRDPDTGKTEGRTIPEGVATYLSNLQLTNQGELYDQEVRRLVFGQRTPTAAVAPATTATSVTAAVGAPTVADQVDATGQVSAPIAQVSSRPPTTAESAATAAGAETRARESAKSGVEAFTRSRNAYEKAPILFNSAKTMSQLAIDNPKAFEVLSKPGLANSIMRAADKGIQLGQMGSISLPAEEINKFKLSKEDLDAANIFANQLAIAKNANREMTRIAGEGAFSNFETEMANAMLSIPYASPEVIQMINQYTMMRANHIRQKHLLWQQLVDQGMDENKALVAEPMQNLEEGYQNALMALSRQNSKLLSSAPASRKQSKTAPSGAITPEAIEAERKRRGLK